jgi:hypothetical protein
VESSAWCGDTSKCQTFDSYMQTALINLQDIILHRLINEILEVLQ